MTRQTTAVVIAAPGEVGLQPVMLKAPGPHDVVIETAYTSISAGTERMLLAGQMPHPMLRLPVIPGYETVGRIVATGADVDAAWRDRWVYVGGALCYEDVNAAWGGQAALLSTAVERVVPLEELDPRHGLLLALAATALHGVDQVQPTAGQRVLVLGQGPVGQLAARFAQQTGAWVAVADRVPSRLAKSVADQVVNVQAQPLAEAISPGVDVIIEATGSMEVLASALPLLTPRSTILLLGYYQTLQLPYMSLFLKEARLLTAKEWAPGDLVRCRNALQTGTVEVASLLTHQLPITAVTQAYDVALTDPDCLKLVLDWAELSS